MDAHATQTPRRSRFGNPQLFFVVDAEFADSVSRSRWSNTCGYLESFCPDTKRRLKLHRFVWSLAHGSCPRILDHINGVRWDCRLSNLRPATSSLNARNRRVHRASGLPRGVGQRVGKWRNTPKRFYARIRIGGKQKFLGYYETPWEAAQAYELAAVKVSEIESMQAAMEVQDAR